MQFPIVHLNGTSVESLREAYAEQMAAVRICMKALEKHDVLHARDYYKSPDRQAWNRAREEAQARMDVLVKLHEELYKIWSFLYDDEACDTSRQQLDRSR